MLGVLASVLIFGLVHPASKLFLDQGLPLSYFCVLYVGIRLLVQMPLAFARFHTRGHGSKRYLLLVLIGLVGGLLQLLEFKGIDQGLPPATVTFLVYSYPIWILAMSWVTKAQAVSLVELAQVGLIMAGLSFFMRGEVATLAVPIGNLMYPLLAALFMALWIVLSNRLRKDGVGIFELSAFYDLFCALALIGIFGGQWADEWSQFLTWSTQASHWLGMVSYSLLVGLLPNALFYLGTRRISSHVSGAVMALEPLVSAMYSAAIWGSKLSPSLYVGGAFILLANIPKEFWIALASRKWLLKSEVIR